MPSKPISSLTTQVRTPSKRGQIQKPDRKRILSKFAISNRGIVYVIMYKWGNTTKYYVGRTKKLTYLGQPRGIKGRCAEHIIGSRKEKKAKFHRFLNSKSKNNFHVFVLGTCSMINVKALELYYVSLLSSHIDPEGLNSTLPNTDKVGSFGGLQTFSQIKERLADRSIVPIDTDVGYFGTLASMFRVPEESNA